MNFKFSELLKEDDNSAVKAGIWYLVCSILVRGMSFICAPIFTRLMTKEDYGIVSNFAAWNTLLYPFLTLNFRAAINKSKYDFDKDNNSFLCSILIISNLVTLVFYVVVEIFSDYFVDIFGINITLIRLLFLSIIFHTSFEYQQIQHNIYRKYKHFVFYSLSSSILSLILSVTFVLILKDKPLARLSGGLIPIILINVFILKDIFRYLKNFDWKYIKYALNISVPMLLSTISAQILGSSDKIIITKYCGTVQTAMYSVGIAMTSISAVIWTSMNQAWSPWLYDNFKQENYEKVKSVSNKYALFYASLICCIMFIVPEVLYIYGGEKYMESLPVFPPVVIGMVCQFFYNFYFSVEYFYGETYMISLGTLIAAVLNIVLNFIFIPKYGYISAAYTTLAGYFAMLTFHYSIVRFKLHKDKIYNNSFFLCVLFGLMILQYLIAQLYSFKLERYAVFGIYLFVLILIILKNKTELKEIVNKIKI